MDKKISFVGAGRMAGAIIQGLIAKKRASNKDILISDKYDLRRLEVEKTYNVKSEASNKMCVRNGEIVFFSVKPQDMGDVLTECRDEIKNKLVVSIAAGIEISFIENIIGTGIHIIRVMPNIAVTVAEGMSVIIKNNSADATDINYVKELLSSVGDVIELKKESLLHAVTALSGSGPAYVFMMLEALSDAGVRMGLNYEESKRLAIQTFAGASKMAKESNLAFATLKNAVTSPAGTTAEALAVLEHYGIRSAIIEAVKSATNRSKEIASES